MIKYFSMLLGIKIYFIRHVLDRWYSYDISQQGCIGSSQTFTPQLLKWINGRQCLVNRLWLLEQKRVSSVGEQHR